MFSNLNLPDFIEIFILMLGSFLIGYGFAYFYFKQKFDSSVHIGAKHINDNLGNIVEGEIKATKTFERGGKAIEEKDQQQIEFFISEKSKAQTKKETDKTKQSTPQKEK